MKIPRPPSGRMKAIATGAAARRPPSVCLRQVPPPFRPSTTAPVGPNRGVIVTHGTAVNRDGSRNRPATQAVARIKRGQGADREAPVAAVVNREIGDGVGATRHEALD